MEEWGDKGVKGVAPTVGTARQQVREWMNRKRGREGNGNKPERGPQEHLAQRTQSQHKAVCECTQNAQIQTNEQKLQTKLPEHVQ